MLPFTTTQVQNGIDHTDYMIDLSDYVKKKDAATKTDIDAILEVVAGKLDASPQHKHHIDDIKQLQLALDSKYDKSEKYSHNVILNDTEKIQYLESPKIEVMEIVKNKDSSGYKFYIDDSNGDLMIVLDDILIGMYSRASSKWSFEADLTDINSQIASHEAILGNHYEALNAVCNATLVNISDIATNKIKIENNTSRINEVETSINNQLSSQSIVLDNHYEALNAVQNATQTNASNISVLDTKVENIENQLDDVTIIVNNNTSNISSNNTKINNNTTKINNIETLINKYIAETDAVLKNHYEAILLLCEKHRMVDSNTNDTPNLTPK